MTRVGIGYDVHRLVRGRPLILGGVRIDHDLGLEGHSDADVLSHAIADALLGAAGLPDIGNLFPNTDPSIEGISSQEILRVVAGRVREAGFEIVNIDSTLVAERPRITPHLDAMRAALSRSLDLPGPRIGIKATTNEAMGFIGRGEGIAALAVAGVGAA